MGTENPIPMSPRSVFFSIIQSILNPIVNKCLRKGEDKEEHRRKVVLIPLSLAMVIVGFGSIVLSWVCGNSSSNERIAQIATSTSLILWNLALVAETMRTKSLSTCMTVLWLSGVAILLLTLDVCYRGKYQAWLLCLSLVDPSLLISSTVFPEILLCFVMLYVIILSLEQNLDVTIMHINKVNELDRQSLDIPPVMTFRIVTLLLVYATSARRTRSLNVEKWRVVSSIDLANCVTEALVNFNLQAAEDLLNNSNSEIPLVESLRKMVHNLHRYKKFLPETLFVEQNFFDAADVYCESVVEGDTEDEAPPALRALGKPPILSNSLNPVNPLASIPSIRRHNQPSCATLGNISIGEVDSRSGSFLTTRNSSLMRRERDTDSGDATRRAHTLTQQTTSSFPSRKKRLSRNSSWKDIIKHPIRPTEASPASSFAGSVEIQPSVGVSRQESTQSVVSMDSSVLPVRHNTKNTIAGIKLISCQGGMSPLSSPKEKGGLTKLTKRGTIVMFEIDPMQSNLRYDRDLISVVMKGAAAALQKIREWRGCVVELRSTAVVATWNTHKPDSSHALQAIRCSVDVADAFSSLSPKPVWWSASCATGNMYLSTIGTSWIRTPVILGDPVLQVRVLGQLSVNLQTHIIISQATQELIKNKFQCKLIDVIPANPTKRYCWKTISVFSVVGMGKGDRDIQEYNDAFSLFAMSRYEEAKQKLITFQMQGHPCYYDRHYRRLLNMISTAITRQGIIPRPYVRVYTGWEEIQVTEIELSLEGHNSEDSFGSEFITPLPGIDLGNIRSEIEKATIPEKGISDNKNNNSSSSSSSSSSSDSSGRISPMPDQVLYPPVEIVDTCGSKIWRSEKVLGSGACGAVWLGMSEDGSLTALKSVSLPSAPPPQKRRRSIRPSAGQEASPIDSLMQEVKVLSSLAHENIVCYKGCCITPNHFIICMECVTGGSLHSVLELFGSIPLSSLTRYAREMLSGLQYLHEHRVAHCDFKPHNVLLQNDGQCKLTDFGTAIYQTRNYLKNAQEVQVQAPVGTPLYMAPEACTGHPIVASDVWAVGLTVCQMITGELPYPAEWQTALAIRFVRKLSKDTSFGPEIPEFECERTRDFITSCLERDPANRPTVTELLRHPFLLAK